MQPHIEALRTDLARVLADAHDDRHQILSMRASHDLALPLLQRHVAGSADLHLEIGFQGSTDALRALNERQCLVAGFHVPLEAAESAVFAKSLKRLLRPDSHVLMGCSVRTQGLITRPALAAQVGDFGDIARHRLRFVNRQPGSGTRMLIDHLLKTHGLKAADLVGFHEHLENTHVSVALCIASGVADVGVGVEAAALEFGLSFVPIVQENYFLACLQENVAEPSIHRLRSILAQTQWREILAKLPGYQPSPAAGELLVLNEVLPWWDREKPRSSASTQHRPRTLA